MDRTDPTAFGGATKEGSCETNASDRMEENLTRYASGWARLWVRVASFLGGEWYGFN